MEALLMQLPEISVVIAEALDDKSASSFGCTCRNAESIITYLFKTRLTRCVGSSFRGWPRINSINSEDPATRWDLLYKEASKIKSSALISWSFHRYLEEACARVYDHSRKRCHGKLAHTTITDGQFGKAMRLPPISTATTQLKTPPPKASVQAMVSSTPITQFTLAVWINIQHCENSPLISLLFTPKKGTPVQPGSLTSGMNMLIMNIMANGKLSIGRSTSEQALQLNTWYHLVITGDSKAVHVHAWDASRGQDDSNIKTAATTGGDYVHMLTCAYAVPGLEQLMLMVGNGVRGDYVIEEMCLLDQALRQDNFWWLRNGLPFLD